MIELNLLAARISDRRRALQMTQSDLAKALNISPQAVSKWERGITYPNTAFLDELAGQLQLSVEELLIGETKP